MGREIIPHPIIPCPGTRAHHDGELGHVRARHRGNELRAILGDAAFFGVGADHEAADVLEEEEGDAALGAELDEVSAF